MLRRAGLMIGLALCVSLAACGGDDDNAAKPASAVAGSALLAQIPTLGEEYPSQLARFVDTGEGKDYGLAVTVADDGKVVAYLCDGKTLGRAFSGSIEDGADSATLKAVKGDGTIDLKLSGDEPSSATVTAGDVTDEFTLASTDVGGYYREEVKGVTRGWVVSDSLAIKGVQTKPAGTDTAANSNKAAVSTATTSGITSPPLSAEDQALVGVQENPDAPPTTQAFFKARRCSRLEASYDAASEAWGNGGGTASANASNLALAKAKSLGCDWVHNDNFITN